MKMMRKQRGSIAVFLVLIMSMMFLFSGVIIDGGRIYAGRNIVSGAGQLALNAGLSTYDVALKDAYGLIAMSETPEELSDNLYNYFVDSLGACGITEEDYNTALVFLEMASKDDFSAEHIDNTEVCRGQVMQQQVMEYMKYRAPVTLSSRILDRIKAAKDMEKIKKVADDEVKTAKAANDVQKQLEKLKDLIDEEKDYNDYIRVTMKLTLGDMLTDSKVATVGEMAVYNFNTLDLKTYQGDAGEYEDIINTFNNYASQLQGHLGNSDKVTGYANAYDVMMDMKAITKIMDNVSEDDFMAFWCDKYGIALEPPADDEEEEDEADAQLREDGKNLYASYGESKNYYDTVPNTISNDVDKKMNSIQKNSKEIHKNAKKGEELSKKITKQVDKIDEKLKKLEGAVNQWKDSNDALPDNYKDIKEENEEKQQEYRDLCKPDGGMIKLKKKAEKNQELYESVKLYIEQAEFADTEVQSVYSSRTSAKASIDTHAGGCNSGADMSAYVKNSNFGYLYTMVNAQNELDMKNLTDLTTMDFYKYLKESCEKKKDKEGIKNANKDVKEKLEYILEELDKMMTSKDLDAIAGKLQEQNASLPTTMMHTAGSGEDKEVSATEDIDIDSSQKRGNSLDDATKSLNTDNTMLSDMIKIADGTVASMMVPIYTTEYMTNMYSCYTSDKTGVKKNGKWETKDSVKSLSEYDMTSDLIYRAEVEYILWGNKNDARKNVGTTKAVIFAIQFVGNLTYALTQKDVRDGAREVGDFFLPNKIVSLVVQVVLEIVVATIETVRDMVILVNGGKVSLLKITAKNKEEEWKTPFKHVFDVSKWDMQKDESSKDALALSYKDYLWIMICAKSVNENNRYQMLERAADLSQINVAISDNKENYLLMKEYTMLQINADVKMDTWLVTDLFGPEQAGLDTSGEYTMHYRGIQGY